MSPTDLADKIVGNDFYVGNILDKSCHQQSIQLAHQHNPSFFIERRSKLKNRFDCIDFGDIGCWRQFMLLTTLSGRDRFFTFKKLPT